MIFISRIYVFIETTTLVILSQILYKTIGDCRLQILNFFV